MVKPHHEMLDFSIKNYKMRIKHHEKHGNGDTAMREKIILKKLERKLELRR